MIAKQDYGKLIVLGIDSTAGSIIFCLIFEKAYRALEVPWGELDAFCEQHQRTRQQK